MQRFYCTVCKRVKRVQRLPFNVVNPMGLLPTDRVGQCAFHADDSLVMRAYKMVKKAVSEPLTTVTIQPVNRKLLKKMGSR